MAISGHLMQCGIMSAFEGKADIVRIGDLCPLMTQSGHWILPRAWLAV